ncbi:MAG: transglutaminase domain-containing protein, partial [Spirochaetales bacterium]|nr:transglutaminase domain-containing protein [Spirochaetales bacterium]
MRDRLPIWARIIVASAAAVLLPGILKILLDADLSWTLLLILVLGAVALSVPSHLLRGTQARLFRLLPALYTAVFAAVVLTGILITPYSAYAIWFETVSDGEPRGVVSVLMVLVAALFSSALARRFLHPQILLPLYSQMLIAAGLAALIYQTPNLYLLLLCLLALGSLVFTLRFVRPGNRLRNLATFLGIFLALAAASRLPLLFAGPRGSRIVDEQLHPGLRETVVTLLPRFPLLYGIPGFGYGFETRRLGARPILSEAPIFEVRGRPGQLLYLRTASYAAYDGRSWSKPGSADRVFPEAAADSAKPDSGPPERVATRKERITPLGPGDISPSWTRITLLAEYYDLVPFTLDTRSIHLPPEQVQGIEGSFEKGYQLADPLRSGQSIYLELGRTQADGEALTAALAGKEAEPYLRLPDGITPETRELAAGLADPGGDTRTTLRTIERYLARNYTYNLEAGRTPAGADFVDTFLFESREGYCVHFASAFTLLARLNGIPARYATGFLVTLPDGSVPFDPAREPGRGTVSGLSSHAWPEVWLEGRGWTAWEATTAVNPSYYEQYGEDWLYEYGLVENRLTNRQLLAILGRRPVS